MRVTGRLCCSVRDFSFPAVILFKVFSLMKHKSERKEDPPNGRGEREAEGGAAAASFAGVMPCLVRSAWRLPQPPTRRSGHAFRLFDSILL